MTLGTEYHDNYLIKDWEKSVVKKVNEKETIKEISEYALHLARIINYPNLNIDYHIKQIEETGEELKEEDKKSKRVETHSRY